MNVQSRFNKPVMLKELVKVNLNTSIGQMRTVPVSLGKNEPSGILAVYCANFDVDPYYEMFFFPTDTLKMALFTEKGEMLWQRDLGKAVIPGVWFCPVFAFDLDGNGVDEIWFVNNLNDKHPLSLKGYCLERVDALSGKTAGQWQWPDGIGQQAAMTDRFRHFIAGGYVKDQPVLVTVQGTYGDMFFQAWNSDMSLRWEKSVSKTDPGARGSHMCPIVDLNGDGVQELLWGERCIDLDRGEELFCADRDSYRGHSDIIIPVHDRVKNKWFIYTCRESDLGVSPRVALFDSRGKRIWGDVDLGHMDMGWIAQLGQNGEHIAMSIRIGHKTCGPDGRFHEGMKEFTYEALTGKPYPLPYSVYRTIPVDLNGDGFHELVCGAPGGNGDVFDRFGNMLGNVGGPVAMALKFVNHPGEQLLTYHEDGMVRIWADSNAKDGKEALERYANPLYKVNSRLMAVGYNISVLTGI